MGLSEKQVTVAENTTKVYDAGLDKAIKEIWGQLLDYGARTSQFQYLHNNVPWTKETYKPNHTVKVTGTSGYFCFRECPPSSYWSQLTRDKQVSMIELEEAHGEPIFDFSECTNVQQAFHGGLFKDWGTLDLSLVTSSAYAFYGGYINGYPDLKPTRIKRLILSENTVFGSYMFGYANGYESIGFEGVIGQDGLNLKDCTKLDKTSLTALVNCLSSTTSGLTVTLSQTAVNNAFTTDEWDALTGTKSNWTISLQ